MPNRNGRNRAGPEAAAIAIAVTAVIALALPTARATAAATDTVVIPRLTGGVVAVYARLHGAGLRVSIPRRLSFSSVAPPRVARAVPRPGRHVRRGSVVVLYLARGSGRSPRRAAHAPSYVVEKFVGGAASVAYSWMRTKRLAFSAHLGALHAGGAQGLLANYRVTRQRPAAGSRLALGYRKGGSAARGGSFRLTPLTVWAGQPAPGAQTGPASTAGLTTATVTGTIAAYGSPTTYYFTYGPTRAYGAHSEATAARWGNVKVPANAALSGLAPATTYHYRLVATNSNGTSYGADRTFTTSGYYQNAVFTAAAIPDPYVLDNAGSHSDYWAFATGDRFPVLHSSDLVHWDARGTAMSTRPAWVTNASNWHPWAPSVIESSQSCPGTTSTGCYIMYYVGLSGTLNVNCIGVATSPTPGGLYRDQGPLTQSNTAGSRSQPIGCRDDAGKGNIDPSPFVDSSGRAYLYVSTDRTCSGGSCTLQPTISVIPLTSDLEHAAGPRVALFAGDPGTWEADGVQAPTVEGPSLEFHDGVYYLFYSGGSWQGPYGMGYATATSPTGPFSKSPPNPILAMSSAVRTPGGGDALVTGPHQGLWLVYAGRDSTYTAPRMLRLDRFAWRADDGPDLPVIGGPTTTPQATQP